MNASKLLLGTVLFGFLATSALTPVAAQASQAPATDTAVVVDDDRDDGFDWGLLGLLGLLGLIPRKRADVVVQRDDVNRNNPNANGPNRL